MQTLVAVVALVGCGGGPTRPEAGPLKAAFAAVPLDAPIGVPLGGYSRHLEKGDPGSPFAKSFPSSRGVHTSPLARALALDDGLTRVVVVRIDAALVTWSLQQRATVHLGRPDVSLVVTATHTHAGPARFFRPAFSAGAGGFDVAAQAMDSYDAEVEDRLAVSIARAARVALDGVRAVRVGHAELDASELNADRRCQNDDLYGADYKDGTLRVLRFDALDGTPVGAVAAFAVHGTVLGSDNALMSSDVSGAIELAASDALGVPVMFLQGAAGDVSPHSGPYGGFQAVERLGLLGGQRVQAAFARAAFGEDATLQLTRRAVSITRAGIGYTQGEFPENGAVGCGLLGGDRCVQYTAPEDQLCLPLARTGVTQTQLGALRVGPAMFVFLPGEPTTAVGARVREAAAAVPGVETVFIAGYAQDHMGYLLEQEDFLRGGYEPTVSPLGWKFAGHVVTEARAMLASLTEPQPLFVPPPLEEPVRRAASSSLGAPRVVEQPAALERLGTARFRFAGADPALGTPQVALEVEQAGAFVPVTVAGRAVVNGPELVLWYDAVPTFVAEPMAASRDHLYSVEWETLPTTPPGRYRLVATGPMYRLESAPFDVTPSRAAGARAGATMTSQGQLVVRLRFPPNPPGLHGNYRLRDLDSTADEGALARGGSATARVNGAPVTLRWSDEAKGLVAELGAVTGPVAVDLAAGDFTDGAGNQNGTAVHVEAAAQ